MTFRKMTQTLLHSLHLCGLWRHCAGTKEEEVSRVHTCHCSPRDSLLRDSVFICLRMVEDKITHSLAGATDLANNRICAQKCENYKLIIIIFGLRFPQFSVKHLLWADVDHHRKNAKMLVCATTNFENGRQCFIARRPSFPAH